jgi:hypothetical protein
VPYLLDANVFIEAKNAYYGFDFAPGFWDWLDWEHANGNVYSIEKARDELIGGDDELADWAKNKDHNFFLAPDETMLPTLATIAAWARSGRYEGAAAIAWPDWPFRCRSRANGGLRDGQPAGLGSPAARIVDGDRNTVAGLVLGCREVGCQSAGVDKLRVLINAVCLYARLLNKP